MQFLQPDLSNPPISGDFQAPDSVKGILKRACYDCHSNETELRWYDKLSPLSHQVAAHVKEGREHLNFSQWQSLAPAAQKAKLWAAVNQIAAGAMPIPSYRLVHASAKITDKELQTLKNYLMSMLNPGPADTAKIHAANRQWSAWNNTDMHLSELPQAANGITYIPDYKNWVAISATERFDNGTMRIIYANDIAVEAIKAGEINPWPKGAILAKVAWEQLEDAAGNVRTGSFKQVEYMIKDAEKYKSSNGWGFARFTTPKLKPYGETAMFVNECVACHKPMADNDFVFTQPFKP